MAKQRKTGQVKAAPPAARSTAEPASPSGRLGWRAVLEAHAGWQALVAGLDVAYGPRQVTVSGVAPAARTRLARCASLALAAHGYDARREVSAAEPTVVRVRILGDGG